MLYWRQFNNQTFQMYEMLYNGSWEEKQYVLSLEEGTLIISNHWRAWSDLQLLVYELIRFCGTTDVCLGASPSYVSNSHFGRSATSLFKNKRGLKWLLKVFFQNKTKKIFMVFFTCFCKWSSLQIFRNR